jgi:hypothetical protein
MNPPPVLFMAIIAATAVAAFPLVCIIVGAMIALLPYIVAAAGIFIAVVVIGAYAMNGPRGRRGYIWDSLRRT